MRKLSLKDIYLTKSSKNYAGLENNKNSRYEIIGVPFDSSTSYKPGTRFGPDAIRQAASGLESNSYFSDIYLEDIGIIDEGDVGIVIGDINETLNRITGVISDVIQENKIPIMIGGEHTITYGSMRAFKKQGITPCLIVIDAHYDLRDEYLGLKNGHASVMRRSLELLGGTKINYIGVRAYSKEEKNYALSKNNINTIKPSDIYKVGLINAINSVKKFLVDCKHIYLSIDMDGFDPSYAPGVGNPEPGGITNIEGLTIINQIVDERLVGADVVEVSPPYDQGGITSSLAAKLINEIIMKNYISLSKKNS
ncbi:agmatinase [Caldisphaera lagunensis]|uniref:agmatinase n=1 Tax=Caldisphaera lagunensis TaxID=200415 RepID=UPI003CCBA8C7